MSASESCMIRRRFLLRLAGGAILPAWAWGGPAPTEAMAKKPMTLKERIIRLRNDPSTYELAKKDSQLERTLTALASEYFHLGMTTEEAIAVLKENDMEITVQRSYTNQNIKRRTDRGIYYDHVIVSGLEYRRFFIISSYSIILRFDNDKIVEIFGVRNITGP